MELGNYVFGHSRGNYPIDRDSISANMFIQYLDLMGFYEDSRQYEEFKNEIFEYRPYAWDCGCKPNECDCDDEFCDDRTHTSECEFIKPNFVHYKSGLNINWYKYPLRDAYSSIPLTPTFIHDVMEECYQSIRKIYKWGLPNTNMVDISKLREGFKRVYVNGEIESVSEPREVTIKASNTKASVVEAVLKDATGSITLSLWNEQGRMVKAGSKVKVENGFVTAFKGKNQLSLGKFGKLAVLEF